MLILAGLFGALVVFVAFGPGRQAVPEPSIPTTYSSGPGGALAFYQWARSIGFDAQRLEYRPFALADTDNALVMLSPSEPVSRAHARTALAWVERGGTLILADDTSAVFGPANTLLDELRFEVAVLTATATLESAAPLQPALTSPLVTGAPVAARRFLIPQRDDYAPLLGSKEALIVAGVRHGQGYVFVSASAYPFTNDGLRDPQNAALALNMLRRVPQGGRILFDEFHHGYDAPPSTTTTIFSTPWGWAGAYAAAVVALYLVLTGRRFGRPVPLREEVARRSSAEYVESMADLFQRSGKRDYMLRHYVSAFKRRLAKPAGISPQLPDEAFVRELARAQPLDEAALLGLLKRLRAPAPNEASLLQLVAEADAYEIA
jgi:hypothetical protein